MTLTLHHDNYNNEKQIHYNEKIKFQESLSNYEFKNFNTYTKKVNLLKTGELSC